METYEKICKVIELYNKYKGNLNDDGTVATAEQIAEWIVPSVEDCKEINEEELDKLAMIKYPCNCSLDENYCDCCMNPDLKEAFKAGCKEMLKRLS